MFHPVRPKKHLGQHFLEDPAIAKTIVDSLTVRDRRNVIEIGPGTGVLTEFLVQREDIELYLMDIDEESIQFLKDKYPLLRDKILLADFLNADLASFLPCSIIGNFPYNISTQILFRVLEYKDHIDEVVGMFQKEVALRIASPPGNKDYGILSVLLQPWYEFEYIMTVDENKFFPPPRVKSAVIKMVRNERQGLGTDEMFFKQLVKLAFNQRRKTLRNSIRQLLPENHNNIPYLSLRAEALSWQQFVELSELLKRD